MEIDILKIKEIYLKRISLFKDLLNCIDRERDNLINQDINGIWSTMEEKQRILESLEETNGQIQKIDGREPSYRDIPHEERHSIVELTQTLSDLKEEAKVRVGENMSFIKETLDFFHDIIFQFIFRAKIKRTL